MRTPTQTLDKKKILYEQIRVQKKIRQHSNATPTILVFLQYR